ncbi:cytochrome p450 benzoate 4-monooxygenase, partial [Grosmannia clavigera kw1407]
MVHRLHSKYGDFVRIAPNHVSIADPRALQDIYGHNTGFVKGPFYDAFHQTEPGLFGLRNLDMHQKRRKLITPFFSPANLTAFEPQVSASVLKLRQSLSGIAASEQPTTNFSLYGFLDRGYDHSNLIESLDSRGLVVNALGYMPSWCRLLMMYNFFGYFWHRGLSGLCHLGVVGRTAYFSRKAGTVTRDRKDVLSFVIEPGNEKAAGAYSEVALVAESVGLIIGGSDTTSSTMTHFVDLVSRDPLLQKRLQDKLDAAFPGVEGEGNWVADFATADKLPILRATLRETMRLRPTSATGLERVTPPGGRVVADVSIPAGLTCVPSKDPTDFNIDRWLQPDAGQLSEYFKPFSLRPRSCIGRNFAWMEAIKTLAALFCLLNFSRARNGPTELKEGFILKVKECMVRVSRRDIDRIVTFSDVESP